jgi:hypothetical protein
VALVRNVSEELIASFIRVTKIDEEAKEKLAYVVS